MRILAIGLGGAGSRIANSLYAVDHRSSNVACVKALAIDVDEATFKQLKDLPEEYKIYFPALYPGSLDAKGESTQTATIDIGEIVARVQNINYAETDAIFICCGLGGSMVDVAPHIIAALRNSVVEPIFGLVTLPCLAEGERRSAKAADDIDMLSSLLDGIILFDNETWFKKTRSQKFTLAKKEKNFAEKMGFVKEQPVLSPKLATYLLLNDAIVKRISLILRAGEFKPDGGLELAEVVLDSGEVLNTMKGMGFITIGYAVEQLPHDPLGFLSWLRPAGVVAEDHNKRASRIVELAKQAIYHEISTPCDMTSAHKALVLIAGPSHELSMKGFMTVRKWIDRSIAGLETRSGDYPVVNTHNVAIIVMLSGLENIPRVDEIRGIRAQGRTSYQKATREHESISLESITLSDGGRGKTWTSADTQKPKDRLLRDEMIAIPVQEQSGRDQNVRTPVAHTRASESQESLRAGINRAINKDLPGSDYPSSAVTRENTAGTQEKGAKSHQFHSNEPQYRVIPRQEHETPPGSPSTVPDPQRHRAVHHDAPVSGARVQEPVREKGVPLNDNQIRTKDTERQRIEKDLQRQRMIAISGRTPHANTDITRKPVVPPVRKVVHNDSSIEAPFAPVHQVKQSSRDSQPPHAIEKPPEEHRTVIIGKRKARPVVEQERGEEDKDVLKPVEQEDIPGSSDLDVVSPGAGSDEMQVSVKDHSYRAKDKIFGGKTIVRTAVPQARDSGFENAQLAHKKSGTETGNDTESEGQDGVASEQSQSPEKKRKITTKKDDFSWI